MTLKTCTKVNVGLNVLRKRPDGYHDLETLFVPYWGFGDELTVEPAKELSIEIFREGGVDWNPMEDLTVRAWRLLKADFPSLPAVSIRLVKGAPVGAGLGGGSADAAFMLRALDELGGLGLSDAELASYAAKLGSDCAFFVGTKNAPGREQADYPPAPPGDGGRTPRDPLCRYAPYSIGPMFATGRGEILEPFDIDLSGYDLHVEIPLDASTGLPVAVSTREAYGGIIPRDNRHTPTIIPLHPQGTGGVPPETPCVGPAVLQNVPRDQRGSSGAVARSFAGDPDLSGAFGSRKGRGPACGEAPRRGLVPGNSATALRDALRLPIEQWRGIVVNDFEATVCPRHPEISALIEDFYRRGAVYAAMSGSGSSVFGLFRR